MATIGYVTKLEDGRYQGNLKTLTIRAEVTFTPNPDKSNDNQPDCLVFPMALRSARPGSGKQKPPLFCFGSDADVRNVSPDFCGVPR